MSKSSYKEFVSMKDSELYDKLVLSKKELFTLRFQKTLGELTNLSRFSSVRKTIARINTEINKRKNLKK